MLRIYARVLTVVLTVVATTAAVCIPGWGLGTGVLYLGSAAVFGYAGFWQGDTAIVRRVVATICSFSCFRGCSWRSPWASLGSPSEGGVGKWGWRKPPSAA
jgi:hypothetical protein